MPDQGAVSAFYPAVGQRVRVLEHNACPAFDAVITAAPGDDLGLWTVRAEGGDEAATTQQQWGALPSRVHFDNLAAPRSSSGTVAFPSAMQWLRFGGGTAAAGAPTPAPATKAKAAATPEAKAARLAALLEGVASAQRRIEALEAAAQARAAAAARVRSLQGGRLAALLEGVASAQRRIEALEAAAPGQPPPRASAPGVFPTALHWLRFGSSAGSAGVAAAPPSAPSAASAPEFPTAVCAGTAPTAADQKQ